MAHDVIATGELSATEVREAWGENHNPEQIKTLWDQGALHTTCRTKQEAAEALGKHLEQPEAERVLGELID